MRLQTAFFLLFASGAMCRADYHVSVTSLVRGPCPPGNSIVVGRVTTDVPLTLTDGLSSLRLAGEIEGVGANQFGAFTGVYDPAANTLNVSQRYVLRRTYPRVLCLGDSITYSNPGDAPGWTGSWGMNAPTEAEDYVHRLWTRLREANAGNAIYTLTSHGGGQTGGKITHVLAKMATWQEFRADLATIQIGENDLALTPAEFGARCRQLRDGLLASNPRMRIFWWGVWNSHSSYPPTSKEAQFEGVLRQVSDEKRIPFRSLKTIAMNPADHNHDQCPSGVAWHPNSAGMAGYVDLFWDAMEAELE